MLWQNLLLVLSFLVFSCYGSETPTQIFSRLMKNYSRNEAPGFPDKPTGVNLEMYVINIQYLGDESSDFWLTFYFRQKWKDPRLSFSTADGKTKTIRFPDDSWKQIWVPDTFIRGARKVKVDDDMSSNRLLRLTSTGDVLYVMTLSAIIPSRFNLRNYPFDKQRLVLIFESFGYTTDTLFFKHTDVQLDSELVLGQFHLKDVHISDCAVNYTSGPYPCQKVVFAVERRSSQFIVQFYLPSILIVILSWLAFWINLETSSQSRLLTGILSLLALIILDAFAGLSNVKTTFNCWMIACYAFVFGTLVQYAVVNVLSKKPSGARGLEFLKPPFAKAEKAIETQNEKEVDGGDGKRKVRLVDWFSRICFPVAFLIFNLFYWIWAIA